MQVSMWLSTSRRYCLFLSWKTLWTKSRSTTCRHPGSRVDACDRDAAWQTRRGGSS